MPLTVTKQTDAVSGVQEFVIGDRKALICNITFDNSYPTGGELVDPAVFGDWIQVDAVVPMGTNAGNRVVTYDRANKKLLLFTALGTEAANASDQSAVVLNALVIGK
jgi:hypothetical protein